MERALLIINRTAGTGQGDSDVNELGLLFKQDFEQNAQVQVELINNHADARARAAEFICDSEAPALIVAGGGGGTLRAVIEGVCDSRSSEELPAAQRVRVGALRMGSGNILAKQFGVPRDPMHALRGLLLNLKAGRTAPCCVMRCETWTRSGDSEAHYAVSMGGLGQFGHVPSDLARWHARFPIVRNTAARLVGIEKVTDAEYGLALFNRACSGVLFPDGDGTIEIQLQGRTERFSLLSGIVLNFPLPQLPFNHTVAIEDEALSVYLIPRGSRWSPLLQLFAPQRLIPHTRHIRLEKNQRLEIRFVDRDTVEFFLDEDPMATYQRLSFAVAGSIAFVPGPDYRGASL